MPAKPLTPEQMGDAQRLMAIFEEHKTKYGLTQAALADDLGYSVQSSVSQYLKGKIPLNMEAAVKFARRFECRVSAFSPSIQGEIDRISEFSSTSVGRNMKNIEQTKGQQNAQQLQDSMIKNDEIISEGVIFQNIFMNSDNEVKEVAKFVLQDSKDASPEWADSDARAYIESLKYKAMKWLNGAEKKTGTR